jgi:flagellar motility protein MotE (MotC chaperone)
LVQVYSNMKPNQAAKVFETMDEDLVIEILGRMKKKNAADILNLVKVDKAQKFSERYAGYRTPANANQNSEPSENGPSETQQKP